MKKYFILLLLSTNLFSIKGSYEKKTKYKDLIKASCLIKYKDSSSLCSGTIIKNNEILTAAHCLYNKEEKKEREIDKILCSPDKKGNNFKKVIKSEKIEKKWIPERYKELTNESEKLKHDLGLITLLIEFQDIKPLRFNKSKNIYLNNMDCVIAGFGENNEKKVEDLKIAEIEATNLNIFKQNHTIEMNIYNRTKESFNRTAPGDSGGPLFCCKKTDKNNCAIYGINIKADNSDSSLFELNFVWLTPYEYLNKF